MKTEKIETFRGLLRSQDVSTELCDLAHDHNRALDIIRFRGVPESRARYLSQALDVLLTRLDREAQALRAGTRIAEDRLAAIERQVRDEITDMRAEIERLRHCNEGIGPDGTEYADAHKDRCAGRERAALEKRADRLRAIIDAPDAGGEN